MIETTTKEALGISSTLSLPRSMITHVAGILAMRGMGKSYLASVLMIKAFRPHENVLMHLIVDESDVFALQFPQSAEARRSLAAMHKLARRFRAAR